MSIRSRVGSGTSVAIYLPRSLHAPDRPAAEDAVQYLARANETVLVVEDNREVRAVTVSLLDQLGYRTVAVTNAQEALEALASRQGVNVIFTDVVLPGQSDGLLLARTIKARHPEVPIVLTTGYVKDFDADFEFPVLRKPYQIAALGRVIREALDGPR
jgi:CheY-like chemotaxis protein